MSTARRTVGQRKCLRYPQIVADRPSVSLRDLHSMSSKKTTTSLSRKKTFCAECTESCQTVAHGVSTTGMTVHPTDITFVPAVSDTNAASLSWWPKQEQWNHPACEFNKGYWSWENELWYLKRRRDIENGSAKAMTVKQWQNELRQGRWRKSLNCLQEVAALRIRDVRHL